MRKIICSNAKGEAIVIGYTDPYWLNDVEGIGTPKYTIYTTKGSTQDGENYVSSNAEMRDIEITVLVTENVIENVNRLYDIFIPKQKGILKYYRDEIACQIEYVVESLTPANNGYSKFVNIILRCPNAFFQDIAESKVSVAYYRGLIKFPFTLPNAPFKMTERIENLIASVPNTSNMDLGMTIVFSANAPVANPSLFNVDTREYFKVFFQMVTGDEITVTTHYKNKHVMLYRNGISTEITHLIDYESTWLKAYDGDNLFRYNADADITNLDVSIYYRQLRLGVV